MLLLQGPAVPVQQPSHPPEEQGVAPHVAVRTSSPQEAPAPSRGVTTSRVRTRVPPPQVAEQSL